MPRNPEISRRQFTRLAGAAVATLMLPTPGWARSNRAADGDGRWPGHYDLTIGTTSVSFGGRRATATGINGTVPGPLLRFREGERVTLDVLNTLSEDSSLHWHGLLLPAGMDGVPGISFAGIPPGERFRYEYDVVQNGTYWYHSHSGLQEQSGVYGPIIIDPAGRDPVEYDSEFVVLLSDWTFEDPWTVFANLKKAGDHYNRQKRTVFDFFRDAAQSGFSEARAERAMWGRMRMEPTDIADVTGATYTYLMNGSDPAANWTACFRPGERVRLRVINGSAMSFFNVRIPGLEMEVVQADGQNVKPLTVDEFQIAVAETYDVVVQPKDDRAYTIFAESMDRSGFARGTLAPRPGMTAELPRLREPPRLTMEDMGMAHAAAGAGDAVAEHSHMHQSAPGHSPHTAAVQDQRSAAITRHEHVMGPGVAGVSATAVSRLDHPGTGLENAGHRVLRYRDLRSLRRNSDTRAPERSIELHLTGNMERYMWSFDGLKFSEVHEPIEFRYGERLRMVLVNDTMMAHPIHLHGMFVELVNGNGAHNPLKHTVNLKPAERLEVDLTADAPGDWAFHCHLLYHMNAGMMRAVRVRDRDSG